MNSKRLIAENFPNLSPAAYRNHLSKLVELGLLTKLEHGGGRTSGGRGKSSRYLVISPVVKEKRPPQGVLPDIPRSPEAEPPALEVSQERENIDAGAAHRRLDEMLAAGISPAQIVALLDANAGTLIESTDNSVRGPDAEGTGRETRQIQAETRKVQTETRHKNWRVSEKHATKSGEFPRNMQENVAGFDEETCQGEEKHARF